MKSFDPRCQAGLSIIEVVIAMAICSISVGCLVGGYVHSTTAIERAGHSLAANAMAMQQVERTRAAKWDIITSPPIDELTASNFPTRVAILDLPRSGNNIAYATNFTDVSVVSTNPPLKMVRVDCVWSFMSRKAFTNTMVTYRRPD
jgi:Tfp pilus assembly protein PilV